MSGRPVSTTTMTTMIAVCLASAVTAVMELESATVPEPYR